MKLGIYTRVSTDEQAIKGLSLENQLKRGKELAMKLGCDFKVFSDAGLSGKIPFDKRPGLNSLLNDVVAKKIDMIFVIDQDRLSRADIIQTTLIKNIIKENGVRLFELDKETDLNDINQELLTDIKSLLNAFEIKKTSGRIKTVLEQNVQLGKVGGGPLLPYGYTKDENKMLIIDQKESEIVKLIYKHSLEGKGTKMIATILNGMGIPTKRGLAKNGKTLKVKGKVKSNFVWRDAVVYKILTNSLYMGERIYREKKYACPAIVDRTTFNLVADKLKRRNYFKNTTNKYDYLLKGLIYCPVCKGRFFGHKRMNGKDNAYVCNSKRYGGEFCGNNGINIDYLDDLVIENIKNLDKITEQAFMYSETSESMKGQKATLDLFRKLYKENESRMNNIIKMVEDAKINPSTFRTRLHELNKEKSKLTKEIEKQEKTLGVLSQKDVIMKFVKEVVKDFRKIKDAEEKKLIIQNVVSRITIRWNKEELRHMIGIFFRVDKLNQYLLSKELIVDRTKRKEKKALTVVINEKIMISNSIGFSDEDIALIRYN